MQTIQQNHSFQSSVSNPISQSKLMLKCQKLLLNENPVTTKYTSVFQARQYKNSSLSVYQDPLADREKLQVRSIKNIAGASNSW